MSVLGNRNFSRIAGCCLLVLFAAMPASVMANDDVTPPPHSDSIQEPEGMLCTDEMIEEPYADDLEPTPAAHVDGGCSVSELPIST